MNRFTSGPSGEGQTLSRRTSFDQSAAAQRDDRIRLGPQAVTGTTTGAAHTLFTVDTDSLLWLKDVLVYNSAASAVTVYFMIDATTIVAEEIPAGFTEVFNFGDLPLYSAEVLKVYASAASGITVTGAAQRQNA